MARFDGNTEDLRPARGRERMKQLTAEMKAAIQTNIASLLASLNREPSPDETALAELIASGILRARRLRENGRSDLEVLREVAPMLRDFRQLRAGARPEPATGQPPA